MLGPLALPLRPWCQHIPAAGKHQRHEPSWFPKHEDRVAPGRCPPAAQVLSPSSHQPRPGGARRTGEGQDGARDGPCPSCPLGCCCCGAGPCCSPMPGTPGIGEQRGPAPQQQLQDVKSPELLWHPLCPGLGGPGGALQPPPLFTCPSAWVRSEEDCPVPCRGHKHGAAGPLRDGGSWGSAPRVCSPGGGAARSRCLEEPRRGLVGCRRARLSLLPDVSVRCPPGVRGSVSPSAVCELQELEKMVWEVKDVLFSENEKCP